jgi:hypothetical protein
MMRRFVDLRCFKHPRSDPRYQELKDGVEIGYRGIPIGSPYQWLESKRPELVSHHSKSQSRWLKLKRCFGKKQRLWISLYSFILGTWM